MLSLEELIKRLRDAEVEKGHSFNAEALNEIIEEREVKKASENTEKENNVRYTFDKEYLHLRPMVWLYKTMKENTSIKAVLYTGAQAIPLDKLTFIKLLFLLGDRSLGRHDAKAFIVIEGELSKQEQKELDFIKENMALDSEMLDSEEYLDFKKFDFGSVSNSVKYDDVPKYGFDIIKTKIQNLS